MGLHHLRKTAAWILFALQLHVVVHFLTLLPALGFALRKKLLHFPTQAVGQLERVFPFGGQHFVGGLLRQWIHSRLLHFVGELSSALGTFRKLLLGILGIFP